MVTIFYKYIRGLLYGSEMLKRSLKKSQVSMEYILITAFSLLIVMPMVILFFQYSQAYNEDVNINQANKVMDEILNAAETVHYLGEPSQKTISVYFPKNIETIVLSDGYFAFTINPGERPFTMYRTAEINFTGDISTSAGLHTLRIRAVNNTVNIGSPSS